MDASNDYQDERLFERVSEPEPEIDEEFLADDPGAWDDLGDY